jgi:hypothetical protein
MGRAVHEDGDTPCEPEGPSASQEAAGERMRQNILFRMGTCPSGAGRQGFASKSVGFTARPATGRDDFKSA